MMAPTAFVKPKATPRKVLETFGETTSAHGVPKIIGATSYLSSFIWTAVFLAALGALCIQGGMLIHAFFQWPYTTKLDIVTSPTLQFPAVTICNMNKLRRSQLVGTEYERLISLDSGPRGDADYEWWFDFPEGFYEYFASSSDDYPSPLQPESSTGPIQDALPVDDKEPPINFVSNIVSQRSDTTGSPGAATGHSGTPGTSGTPAMGTPATGTAATGKATDGVPSADSNPTAQQSKMTESPEPEANFPDNSMSQASPPPPQVRKRRSATGDRLVRETSHGEVRVPRDTASTFPDVFKQFAGLRTNDFQFYDPLDLTAIDGKDDWLEIDRQITMGGDYNKWHDVVNPTKEEVRRIGHQADKFIAQCVFDKKYCSADDFYMFQSNLYGNCFVFNHAVNMSEPQYTGKTGAQNGLHLTLFVEQPEYIGLLTQETGVRVAIHDPYAIPYPEDDGFTVSTGVSSSIGIRQAFIKRLPEPHGNCSTGANSNFSSTEFQYSRRACQKQCFQKHLDQKCGCVTDIMMDMPLCDAVNSSQEVCKQLTETLFQEDQLECTCPIPCSEFAYRKTVSSSTWPSEKFEPHLVTLLEDKDVQIGRILRDVTLTRKNLVQLKIYFEELNYESIEQTPLYTVEGLLGGVGGLMGLYVGISVITLFEIAAFVGRFVRASCDKVKDRDKVQQFSAEKDPQAVPDYNYGYKGTGLL